MDNTTSGGFTDLVRQAARVLLLPIHPAGVPFVIAFFIVAFILVLIDGTLGLLGLIVALWCVYFFRNPDRFTPTRDGLVVSPADGIVSMITETELPPEIARPEGEDGLFTPERVTRISIFLNVFDVHVNRSPVGGEVTQVVYQTGKFLNAGLDKASLENERSTVVVRLADRPASVAFVQIAGLVARRIICDATVGQTIKTGQRYGLIRFGSRLDVYLPAGCTPLVSVGQRMIGGETVIADMASTEAPRLAEKR